MAQKNTIAFLTLVHYDFVMKTVTTLYDYCREVNIPPPEYAFFDVRRFEDKVKTENSKQEPFRHEFYSIGLRRSGQNKQVNGEVLHANLFFNSPYQVISWDVLPDWKGWYILFDRNFLATNPNWTNFINEFSFFQLDKSIPFDLPEPDENLADSLFEKIFNEYHSSNKDNFRFIQSYTQLLLLLTKRHFLQLDIPSNTLKANRTADILLVSRFQTMIETAMSDKNATAAIRQPAFYASQLNVHPNHLNAVVKRISGKTASNLIQYRLTSIAKSLLKQTTLSVKEIAFQTHFTEPTHFNAFFKKNTGFTPQQYRDSIL